MAFPQEFSGNVAKKDPGALFHMAKWIRCTNDTSRRLLGLCLCLFVLLSGPAGTIPEDDYAESDPIAYERYAADVAALDQDAHSFLKFRFFLYWSKFIKLSKNPHEKLAIALKYIGNEPNSQHQWMVILSMYKLSLEDRLIFVNSLLTYYDSGILSENNLNWALFPDFAQGFRLDYRDERVIALMNAFKTRERLSSRFRREIDDLLSGQTLFKTLPNDRIITDWNNHLSISGVPPTWGELYKALKIYLHCKLDVC